MEQHELYDNLQNIKNKYKEERINILIKRYGACPNYKGHFSFANFIFGIIIGGYFSMLITGIAITTIYTCK